MNSWKKRETRWDHLHLPYPTGIYLLSVYFVFSFFFWLFIVSFARRRTDCRWRYGNNRGLLKFIDKFRCCILEIYISILPHNERERNGRKKGLDHTTCVTDCGPSLWRIEFVPGVSRKTLTGEKGTERRRVYERQGRKKATETEARECKRKIWRGGLHAVEGVAGLLGVTNFVQFETFVSIPSLLVSLSLRWRAFIAEIGIYSSGYYYSIVNAPKPTGGSRWRH